MLRENCAEKECEEDGTFRTIFVIAGEIKSILFVPTWPNGRRETDMNSSGPLPFGGSEWANSRKCLSINWMMKKVFGLTEKN